jgi:hypothetical protein
VLPKSGTKLVLLVGEGDPYLETALSYLPNVELYGVTPEEYGPATERQDGRPWDLVIFESTLPATLPDAPILAIAPPRSSALGDVSGTIKDPGIGALSPDEPILRYVDLTTTHISEAQSLTTPEWARVVIPGPKSAPLLYTGDRDGRPNAVLAFEPRESDLPLQVAFPILLANLTGELMGGSAAPTEAVAPGDPVSLTIPSGATGVTVTRPDGSTTPLLATRAGGPTVTFASTELPGVYTITPILPEGAGASGAPSGASGASAAPVGSASAVPGASAGASAAPDGAGPVRFAVDLFDVGESTIAPGSVAAIEAVGRAPTDSPAAGNGGSPITEARPTTRDELWLPIVVIVLLALCLEWAVYHRDAVIRLRRSLGGAR